VPEKFLGKSAERSHTEELVQRKKILSDDRAQKEGEGLGCKAAWAGIEPGSKQPIDLHPKYRGQPERKNVPKALPTMARTGIILRVD